MAIAGTFMLFRCFLSKKGATFLLAPLLTYHDGNRYLFLCRLIKSIHRVNKRSNGSAENKHQ
jgi:hypothetical protein